jgi:hypothetical protein
MASIKEAVQNATLFAQETLGLERTAGLQLEEVESTSVNGQDAWLITLSMTNAVRTMGVTTLFGPRDYKIFTVMKKNGEVVSMRIRELAAT